MGSNISAFDASIYIYGFMHRFKLSEVARNELLSIIHYLLPLENSLPKTVNKLGKKIGLSKILIKENYYCPDCQVLLYRKEK